MGDRTARTWVWWVATLGGIGCLRWVPGTAGALVGCGVWLLTTLLPGSLWWQLGMIAVLVSLGVWVSGRAERELGAVDAQEIVIDEAAAAVLVFLGLPASLVTFAVGIIAFRFFDIVKPFPISRLQRLPGGWGIVADDVAAALVSTVILRGVLLLLR